MMCSNGTHFLFPTIGDDKMGKKNLVFIAPKEDFNLLLAILNRYIYVFH